MGFCPARRVARSRHGAELSVPGVAVRRQSKSRRGGGSGGSVKRLRAHRRGWRGGGKILYAITCGFLFLVRARDWRTWL